MIKRTFLTVFLAGAFLPAIAQMQLSLGQMVDTLLERNYAIRVSRIEEQIAGEMNTPGAAGVYPSVNLLGGIQGSMLNTRQEFFNGEVREADGALNRSAAFGVRADWTLFNGFFVMSTREQLRLEEQFASVNTRLAVEMELYQAAMLYYEIQTREQLIGALENAMVLSKQRVDLAKTRLDIGKGNRLDYLQSLLNLNADSAAWLTARTEVKNLYTSLEGLLSMAPGQGLVLTDSLVFATLPEFVALTSAAENQNSSLTMLKIRERQSAVAIRQARSGRYPFLGVFAEYNFTQSQNAVGVLKSNQGLGPGAGITLQYNLFNGSQVTRDITIAKLRNESAVLQQEQGTLQVKVEMARAYENYLLQKQLAAFEAVNVQTARENLEIARQRLEQGSIDAFQFRDVQQLSLNTEARYLNALFGVKTAELDILLLSGGLMDYFKS